MVLLRGKLRGTFSPGLLYVALLWLMLPATMSWAAAGDFDSTFSGDGRVLTEFGVGAIERGEGVAVGTDGKVVVAGWTTAGEDGKDVDLALARYGNDGELDASFDGDGLVTMDFPAPSTSPDTDDAGADVAIQGGRIAVGGSSFVDSTAFAVAVYRYADGDLDTTFSGDGRVRVHSPDTLSQVSSLAFQPDGKIIVVGSAAQDFVVLRLLQDGRRDPTFGGDGIVITDLSTWDEANDVTVQGDGKIVVVGESNDIFGHSYFAVVRYTETGSLDPTFNRNGIQLTSFGDGNVGHAVAIAPDGKIVVAGMAVIDGTQDVAVLRYRRGGALDRKTSTAVGFSKDGKRRINFGARDVGRAVIVQSDGKIVVVGSTGGNWAISRLLSNGELDLSFSLNGKLDHPMGVATLDIALGVAIAPDGKIVAGGFGGRDFAAARYLAA